MVSLAGGLDRRHLLKSGFAVKGLYGPAGAPSSMYASRVQYVVDAATGQVTDSGVTQAK